MRELKYFPVSKAGLLLTVWGDGHTDGQTEWSDMVSAWVTADYTLHSAVKPDVHSFFILKVKIIIDDIST